MTTETWLWIILIITVTNGAIGVPLALMFDEEMTRVKARQRAEGLLPIGHLMIVFGAITLVAWFMFAWRTDQWLLLAIAVVGQAVRAVFKVIGKKKKVKTDA